MLRLLPFSALDLARYDRCVAASQPASPYAFSWWLAATAGRWDAVVELDAAGDYVSVLPLPVTWGRRGRAVFQPLFTQQLGLLTTPASRYRDLAAYLALAAPRYGGFYQQLPPAAPLPGLLPPGFQLTQRLTYHLDLGSAPAALRQGYAADYRRRLRQHAAQLTAPQVAAGENLDELIELFLAYRGPAETGLRPRHYAPLRRLFGVLKEKNLADLRQVRHPETGALLAGALFVRHAGGLIYLFAAASAAGRQASAPLLLLDDAIGRHAGHPGQVFDFEGGSLPSIGRFFANFGAAPVSYAALSFQNPRWLLAWLRSH